MSEAGHVAETAKDEAKAVVTEVKNQAKDLYAQTQRELSDQAHLQQQRLALPGPRTQPLEEGGEVAHRPVRW